MGRSTAGRPDLRRGALRLLRRPDADGGGVEAQAPGPAGQGRGSVVRTSRAFRAGRCGYSSDPERTRITISGSASTAIALEQSLPHHRIVDSSIEAETLTARKWRKPRTVEIRVAPRVEPSRGGYSQSSCRRTSSERWTSRPGLRSRRWWNATTASSGAAGAWGSTKTTKARCPPSGTEPRSRAGSCACGPRVRRRRLPGWCQFGAPDEVPRIKNRAAYKEPDDVAGVADRLQLR